MYPDGTLVRGPKALCELQGYVYDAWLRMAEIYDELDNKRRANRLRKKAAICSRTSMKHSEMKNPGSMPMRWMATRRKCCRLLPMSVSASGPVSSPPNGQPP
jgi:hypothetical protein